MWKLFGYFWYDSHQEVDAFAIYQSGYDHNLYSRTGGERERESGKKYVHMVRMEMKEKETDTIDRNIPIFASLGRIRNKLGGVHSIGYDIDSLWIQMGSQDKVVPTSVGDTNGSIQCAERCLQYLKVITVVRMIQNERTFKIRNVEITETYSIQYDTARSSN